jgi:NAD(P)H-flavin reductase
VRLASNRPATPTARVSRVSLDGEAFQYRAGQAASLALPGETERTPYSIASAPHETVDHGALEFLVKVDGSTRFGARVSDLLPGTDIAVTGPVGNFVFPADVRGKPLLFIAGGTGIAPLRSMILNALDADMSPAIALLYSA